MKREGPIQKVCEICATPFAVKRCHSKARFCSMRCVGLSQRGMARPARAQVIKSCEICATDFSIYRSHAHRSDCCSRRCAGVLRAGRQSGAGNANWRGGLSRLPYPWNFRFISRQIIARDGGVCQNPTCAGTDQRLTAHHIDYDKANCVDENLITLCSSCNSKANFDRCHWQRFYASLREAFR